MFPQVISVFALFISGLFNPQPEADRMIKLFAQGKSSDISAYFSPSIQLTTPGKEGVYSRSQAKMILEDFFETHEPLQCSLSNKGNSDNGAQFMVLALKTGNGDFKVNIFYRGNGNSVKIHELKIEK